MNEPKHEEVFLSPAEQEASDRAFAELARRKKAAREAEKEVSQTPKPTQA